MTTILLLYPLQVELADSEGFFKDYLDLPHGAAATPVPLHLISRRLRFRRGGSAQQQVGEHTTLLRGGWTDFLVTDDATGSKRCQTMHLDLTDAETALAFRAYLDRSRGPRCCRVVLHRPIELVRMSDA